MMMKTMISGSERDETRTICFGADPLKAIEDALDLLHVGDRALKMAILLSGLTCGMKEKLHVVAVGKSQNGKSHVEMAVASLFPPEKVEFVSSASAKALYYEAKEKGEDYFKGKIVVLDEFADNGGSWPIAKALTSVDAHDLRIKHKTVIDGAYVEMTIGGKPVVLTNACETPNDDQMNNRFFIGNVDESVEQDDRVIRHQNREANEGKASETASGRAKVEAAKAEIVQILSESEVDVRVPFADTLTKPMRNPRTNNVKRLRLIKAVTYARRANRERDPGGAYASATEDGEYALEIWNALEPFQSSQVDATAIKVLDAMTQGKWVHASELLDTSHVPRATLYRKLDRLYESGLIDRGTEGREVIWRKL